MSDTEYKHFSRISCIYFSVCNFSSKDVSAPFIFPLATCALFNSPVLFVRKKRVNPSWKFWRNFNMLVRLRSYEIYVIWEEFLFVCEVFQSPLFDFIVRIPVYAVIKITRIKFFLWPASWSSGQSLWLLIMRSRVRLPALPWVFSLKGKIPAVTMVWAD